MEPIDTPLQQALRKVLRLARKAARIKQGPLARRLGTTQNTISKIETGGRHLYAAEFVRFARAIGRDPGDLIHEAEAIAKLPPMNGKTPEQLRASEPPHKAPQKRVPQRASRTPRKK